MRAAWVVLVLALTAACSSQAPVDDQAAIRQVLDQWPNDFAAKKIDEVCGLFAPDTVVIYPDSADRNYDATCAQFRRVFSGANSYTYAPPEIHEILVDHDLAAVRLIWRLEIRDPKGSVIEKTTENGLDVFARQPDGSWKIRISHAFGMP
ncbi:YybH family protein [Smaragdicoccus niigatensis]|uniref:YybH family protein n=1 Tax=Smaragdicoccus niigatensis TaxID=359359 RepID=UPI0003788C88|nr:DUF4440 domain-containing protein [Smaragdicoccus niigatensis]